MAKATLHLMIVTICIAICGHIVCDADTASADPLDSTIFILPNVSSEAGQILSVPLSISTVHNIGGFNILFETEQGALDAVELTLEGTRSEGLDAFSRTLSNYGIDAVAGLVAFWLPDHVPAGDGPVANLIFTTSASISKGSLLTMGFYDETWIQNGMSDDFGNAIVPDFNHGSILFKVDPADFSAYGDINVNSIEYEIADLSLMYIQLEGGIESYVDEETQTENADINRDGLPWTIADVVHMRNVVVGELLPPPDITDREILYLPGDSIWHDGYTGTPTAEFDVPIYFANTLPAGGIAFKLNYDASELGLISYSLDGSRIPAIWEKVSAVERTSGTMFYAMQNEADPTPDNTLMPGDGLLVTLRFQVLYAPESKIRFHFERLQALGQANGYATIDFPWWNFASFQQIDTDIFLAFVQGDADGSGYIDVDDVVYLLAYIFQGGPAPDVYEQGDFNGDLTIDIDDAVDLLQYIFG